MSETYSFQFCRTSNLENLRPSMQHTHILKTPWHTMQVEADHTNTWEYKSWMHTTFGIMQARHVSKQDMQNAYQTLINITLLK